MKFVYYRSKLFVDIATRFYQMEENKLHGGIKYVLLYIAIAIYVKTIEELLSNIKGHKTITLPDGSVIEPHIF